MKKRNKKYVPKTVVQNPLNYFLGGLKKPDENALVEIKVKNHLAMTNLCQGNGTKDDFDRLAGMSNMALVLTEQHFDNQYHEMLIKARDALHTIGMRFRKMNVFVLRGDEMQAINEAMEVHDAQLEALRVIDIERAYDEIQRRLKHGINVVKIKEIA